MEFNLSENIVKDADMVRVLIVDDVKEFIKRESKLIKKLIEEKISVVDFILEREKLAGDDLIK